MKLEISVISVLSNAILPSSEFMPNQLYEILHCFSSKLVDLNTLKNFLLFFFLF